MKLKNFLSKKLRTLIRTYETQVRGVNNPLKIVRELGRYTTKFLFIISTTLTLLLTISPSPIYAVCGQQYNSGGQLECIDINYNSITPYIVCGVGQIGGNVCCSTQSECPITDPPIIPPEPSEDDCGYWNSSNQCIGNDNLLITGGQRCSAQTSECCNDLALCTSPIDMLGENQYVCDQGDCIDTCEPGYAPNCQPADSCTSPLTPQYCIAGEFASCDEETKTCVVCSPNDNLPGPYGGCEFASLDTCSCLPRPDVKGDCPDKHVDTALGCIPVEQGPFTTAFFRFLVGIAGGLALIVMLIGSIIFLTGGSNPEQVKKGKEIFFGALAGLLFIIISTILLRTIAGDIIGLPNF